MKTPKPPNCPFCGRIIDKPSYLPIGFSDLEAGICECGSVYVCDITGHNRGTAFLEALFIACAGDWDLALSLELDEDYKEIWVENYDLSSHSIIPYLSSEKKWSGVLLFIKLVDELRDYEMEKIKKLLIKEKDIIPQVEKKKLRKNEIEELINKEEISLLIAYHIAEPLNLNIFQKLLYHPDPIFRKKVIITLGKVSKNLVNIYPEKILELLKRLIYASADSAASAWGALEAVGEIIRNTEERFATFITNLLAFMKYPDQRPYALYAIYRVAEKNPQLLKRYSYLKLLNYIEDSSPLIQGLILKIFEVLKSREIFSYLNKVYLNETFDFFNYETLAFEKISLKTLVDKISKGAIANGKNSSK